MKHASTSAVCFLVAALLLGSCASLPRSSINLAEESAVACTRIFRGDPMPQDPELCSLYVDLRLLREVERYLDQAVRPRLTVVPLPCPADGPGCPWQEAYDRRFNAGLQRAFGDPTPHPNKPLPFHAIPAQVQLERTLALREALAQAVTDLDDRIEVLREAVQQ